jgi:hypothetical protein
MHLRVPVSRHIRGYTGDAQWACAYFQSCDVSSKPLCSKCRASEWSVTRLICTPLEQILATVTYRLSECVRLCERDLSLGVESTRVYAVAHVHVREHVGACISVACLTL